MPQYDDIPRAFAVLLEPCFNHSSFSGFVKRQHDRLTKVGWRSFIVIYYLLNNHKRIRVKDFEKPPDQ